MFIRIYFLSAYSHLIWELVTCVFSGVHVIRLMIALDLRTDANCLSWVLDCELAAMMAKTGGDTNGAAVKRL